MRRLLAAPLLLLSFLSNGQSFEDSVRANPLLSANGMYHYTPGTDSLTAPPQGYVPFYISHFSRHGSRYPGLSSEEFISGTIRGLDSLAALRALSPDGLKVLEACHRFYDECSGHWESLTERGAAEHRGIASRMLSNFPEVFTVDSLDVYSTSSKRVMLSRDNFLSVIGPCRINSLMDKSSAHAAQEVKGFVFKQNKKSDVRLWAYPEGMSHYRDDRLLTDIFFSEDCSPSKNDLRIFRGGLHCLEYCLVFEDYSAYLPALELFPVGEFIYNAAKSFNVRLATMGTSSFARNIKSDCRGAGIARKIVEDADRAIAGRDIAATLRFSHDTYALPLACVLGLEGADVDCSPGEVFRHFESIRFSGMAANMQMVFYSDSRGDILVKILWSEKETTVRGLEPADGVYYKWSELREHILNRCRESVPGK